MEEINSQGFSNQAVNNSEGINPKSQIRIYSVSKQNFDGILDLGDCLLTRLVDDIADKIIAVRIDDNLLNATADRQHNQQTYLSQLDNLNFGQNNQVLLASGNTVYFGNPETAKLVRDRFFGTQLDNCCRYGSLLVSSCREGIAELDQTVTVKVVDFEHSNEMERKVAADLRVGDCHGKISPRLAKILGGRENTPFQFRLANVSPLANLPPFIAKGTVAVDSRRTENRGYDLILDRSSIKGWSKNSGPMEVSQINNRWHLKIKPNLTLQQQNNLAYLPSILQHHQVSYHTDSSDGQTYILQQPSKEALDNLAHYYDWGLDRIACGVYELPELIMGNNANAQLREYKNSWQLMQWYSPEAIEQDIVPPTMAEAEYLKRLQDDYRLLARYIVEKHDRRKEIISLENEASDSDQSEFGMIEILRADTRGELAYHPKVASFCRDQLRRTWVELATKGAVTLGSAMAQPAEVKPGTIVAPHLEHGCKVLVTRYPIINKDNIRIYTVLNDQNSNLLQTKGCVYINPSDAMNYHQCDFDGDQLIVTPCDVIPAIAAETRSAQIRLDQEGNDVNRDFKPVVKRLKQPYSGVNLRRTALMVRTNSIGLMANAVGRVNCAQPNPESDPQDQEKFVQYKQALLEVLFDALQIETDSPKSATRYTDYYPRLDQNLSNPVFALPFFDSKQDERLYSSAPMPIAANPSVVDILPHKINQVWESCQLKEMDVLSYKYLLQPNLEALDPHSRNAVNQLATVILQNYNESVINLVQGNAFDSQETKSKFSEIYAFLKDKIVMSQLNTIAKDELAAELWERQHRKYSESTARRKCLDICRHYDPGIYTYQKSKHEYQRDLTKNLPAYIVEAPFESNLFAHLGRKDCAGYVKEILEAHSQEFEVTVHPSKPCAVFAIKRIDPSVKDLFDPYNDPSIARQHDLIDIHKAAKLLGYQNPALYNRLFTYKTNDNVNLPINIVAPRHSDWITPSFKRRSSLVFSIMPERVIKALGREPIQLRLVGKNANAYAQHDLDGIGYRGQEHNFYVGILDNPESDRNGHPLVYMQSPVDGNYYSLGMFSRDFNQLPVQSSFVGQVFTNKKSLDVFVRPGSFTVPEIEMPSRPKKLRSRRIVTRDRHRSGGKGHSTQSRIDAIMQARSQNQELFRKIDQQNPNQISSEIQLEI
ncbi:MAG: hypothetical protein AAFQ80_07870 [Cyanobacteria bacterium J06621_8]